jgi:mRNA-degrading endonuclease RelE of RelBE toxin-antitoxin system
MRFVSYTKPAEKALAAMPAADADAIVTKLDAYAKAGRGDVKKLKGCKFFRLRHGDWRAVFFVTGEEIVVDAIAHRREVYRRGK